MHASVTPRRGTTSRLLRPVADRETATARRLFTVQQRDDRRWHIYETGFAPSLASFGLREDAVEYAVELARGGPEARVQVIDAGGRRESAEV